MGGNGRHQDAGRRKRHGFETVGDLRSSTQDEIVEADYVGSATAEKLLEHLGKYDSTGSQGDPSEIPDQTPIGEFFEGIPDVGRVTRARLQDVGIETVGDLRSSSREELLEADYVGPAAVEKITQQLDKREK